MVIQVLDTCEAFLVTNDRERAAWQKWSYNEMLKFIVRPSMDQADFGYSCRLVAQSLAHNES